MFLCSNPQQEGRYDFKSWSESKASSSLVFNSISSLPVTDASSTSLVFTSMSSLPVSDSRSSLPLVTDASPSLPELDRHGDFVHRANDAADKKREAFERAAKKLQEALELAEIAAGEFARRTKSQDSNNSWDRAQKFIAAARALKTSAEIHAGSGTQSDHEAAVLRGKSAPAPKAEHCSADAIVGKHNKNEAARESEAGCELMQHCAPQNVPRTLVVEGIVKLGIDSLGRLRRHFERYGKVASVVEPQFQSFSGLAYVVMQTEMGATAAVQCGEHQIINQVPIRVSSVTCFASNVSDAHD
eukprot:TRINITY_DN16864_c0_g6_i1.p1 TRINITY_DN16864_c0_g6~~TRINITY_DN16864_c0_g6_i1.p1  ORF type:complete len:300 (-),score=50.13 TRINITY_DN16864_c0_g6_i1:810-1709(-)